MELEIHENSIVTCCLVNRSQNLYNLILDGVYTERSRGPQLDKQKLYFMDELLDVLNPNGNHTGETIMKSEAHRKGVFHTTAHIWFYTKTAKILIQQRGRDKDTFPLLWDISVAGHVGAGEDILISAIREVEEEIGLIINQYNLKKIGVFKSVQKHHESLIDCEFHHAFLCELKTPLNKLVKQDSEVEALDLISITQFAEETWGMANTAKYVPHSVDYYKTIIKAIKEKL